MIRRCVICNQIYKIHDCRWESKKIKIDCCSSKCKKTEQYKKLENEYLLQSRGYPMGFHSKKEYENRFVETITQCEHCLNHFNQKYKTQKYCSHKCSTSSNVRNQKISDSWKSTVNIETVTNKRMATNLKKYGVENCQQNSRIRNKTKASNLKKYGVENLFQDKDRVKAGVNKKYGVDCYFQRTDLMKEHYVNTLGVDNPQKDPTIKQKTLKTVKQKYGELMGAVPAQKTKQTNLERYGTEHFFASEVGKMSYENLKNNYGWTDKQIEGLARKRHTSDLFKCGRATKQSLWYFIPLYKKMRRMGFDRSDIMLGCGDNKELILQDGEKIYFYDFSLPKLKIIIEFNGEKFHPNKNKLNQEEWLTWTCLFSKKSADECYAYDQKKINFAEFLGYTVAEIWSNNSKEENWQIIKNVFSVKGIVL